MGSNGKKISELRGFRMISSYQSESWIPIAQYNPKTSSYYNLAINLQAITDYCNSYSYSLINTLSENLNTMISDNIISYYIPNNDEYDNLLIESKSYIKELIDDNITTLSQKISYITNNLYTFVNNKTNNIINSYVYNNSKKISELRGRETITSYKDHSWIPITQYDSRTDSYHNLAINLQSITNYCNSYSSYLINHLNDNLAYMISNINSVSYYVPDNEIDYDMIMNNSKSYIKELIDDNISYLSKRISYLIINNKPSNSYIRGNSKKISELRGRETITSYQDHSWLPVAQFDARTNTYHNIAMNVKSLTSYSITTIETKLGDVNNMINIAYASAENISYLINNSSIAHNIVSYSFSYSKDYFEWQFL